LELVLPDGLGAGWAAALIAASFVTAAISAAFGIGGGVAMLAVMLAVLPPAVVLPIHGVVQAGSNAGRVVTLRRNVQGSMLGWFTVGTLVGIAAASLVLVALPTATLQIILGVFILWTVWGPRLTARTIPDRAFLLVGAGASFCTMFVGATGPMVAAFWDVKRMGKLGVVATHSACMVVQHAAKVLAFGVLGFAFSEWLAMIVAMLVAGQIGTQVGAHILSRLPERVFEISFKLILTGLALRLLWSAAAGGAS
jgi:uncharacterized membrane protein YfcA